MIRTSKSIASTIPGSKYSRGSEARSPVPGSYNGSNVRRETTTSGAKDPVIMTPTDEDSSEAETILMTGTENEADDKENTKLYYSSTTKSDGTFAYKKSRRDKTSSKTTRAGESGLTKPSGISKSLRTKAGRSRNTNGSYRNLKLKEGNPSKWTGTGDNSLYRRRDIPRLFEEWRNSDPSQSDAIMKLSKSYMDKESNSKWDPSALSDFERELEAISILSGDVAKSWADRTAVTFEKLATISHFKRLYEMAT